MVLKYLNMTLPPFPSLDLAKLVLGYLAEEQLMTAYDEFLQASPYLDALRNEYDRIFMTSLKNILAEYRAVKIYVETCKPVLLRKKLFQCANLPDIVKFLVNNIDINKLTQDGPDKICQEKQGVASTTLLHCESCNNLKLNSCVCKNKQITYNQSLGSQSLSCIEASPSGSCVETTSLSDLPGHHVTTRRKHARVIDKDTIGPTNGPHSNSSTKETFSTNNSHEERTPNTVSHVSILQSNGSTFSLDSTVKAADLSGSKGKIEEFNDILKLVVKKNDTISDSQNNVQSIISNGSTFQDFASGVTGSENQNSTVPDSSTSEILGTRLPTITKEPISSSSSSSSSVKGLTKCQVVLNISHIKDKLDTAPSTAASRQNNSYPLTKIKPKGSDPKIRILSDIKVDKKYVGHEPLYNSNRKNPPLLKNATSTPLMQMQTILINGTPAFNHNNLCNNQNFTKDEIMAMPTLIVVPATGSPVIPITNEPIMAENTKPVMHNTKVCQEKSRVLGPLVIDISPNSETVNEPNKSAATTTVMPTLETQTLETGLVKTVDMVKNASVPKDNTLSGETNTPQVMPLKRKSSSTPRRTSHVRVLDFTTPRRILHETINEQIPSQDSDESPEIVSSNSDGLHSNTSDAINAVIDTNNITIHPINCNVDSGSAKENDTGNKISLTKRIKNWDSDLRAHAIANDDSESLPRRKPQKKSKRKPADNVEKDKKLPKKAQSRKKSPKTRNPKITQKTDDDEGPLKEVTIPVKPVINIVAGTDKICNITIDNKPDKVIEKQQKNNEEVETPELERLSLNNPIDAKLNISDLLETPFKQAIYDIQMETPRFFDANLPIEPLSDIKIMNIPTPRFLDSSKSFQATPSSYSSRPTDYSSGGSYYKPDDQDYIIIPDLECPVTSSLPDTNEESLDTIQNSSKKSRPVRQCTKNVSYYNSSTIGNKTKETNVNVVSPRSDINNIKTSVDCKNVQRTPKVTQDITKSNNKSDYKKHGVTNRKHKSPLSKDKSKSFMKIKPRVEIRARPRKASIDTVKGNSPKLHKRKRTSSKENTVTTAMSHMSVPTKSRRKSSTPRKLHCTKSFNSESSGQNSPDNPVDTTVINKNINRETTGSSILDSDAEQMALRWSDDGSQDTKPTDTTTNTTDTLNDTEDISKIRQFIQNTTLNMNTTTNTTDTLNDTEDISKIRQFIQNTTLNMNNMPVDQNAHFHILLVNRGFDVETAKIIERDLLDPLPITEQSPSVVTREVVDTRNDESHSETTPKTSDITNEMQSTQDEYESDEIELSIHDCHEETSNYIVCNHEETKAIVKKPPINLKDKFSMELCIDDGVTIRLRATPFSLTLDQDPLTVDEIDYSYKETELAVSSISNMQRLYTPLKDPIRAQCYEIFESTLTSLDTPLKNNSPDRIEQEITITDIVIEKDAIEDTDKTDSKKRKRLQSGSEESISDLKKAKPDTQYLFNSTNIQNIDIESVLKKLHGPCIT